MGHGVVLVQYSEAVWKILFTYLTDVSFSQSQDDSNKQISSWKANIILFRLILCKEPWGNDK